MTIETQINRVQYIGNSLATDFPVPFPVMRPEHLKLFLRRDNRQTELTQNFTVLGAGTAQVTVRTGEPVAAGTLLTIIREVPYVQPMSLMNGGAFNAEILEGSADNLAMQIQQLAEMAGRAVRAPESFEAGEVTYETLLELAEKAKAEAERAKAEADRAEAERTAYIPGPAAGAWGLPGWGFFGLKIVNFELAVDRCPPGETMNLEEYDEWAVLPAGARLFLENGGLALELPGPEEDICKEEF